MNNEQLTDQVAFLTLALKSEQQRRKEANAKANEYLDDLHDTASELRQEEGMVIALTEENESIKADLMTQLDNNRTLSKQLETAEDVIKKAKMWKDAAIDIDKKYNALATEFQQYKEYTAADRAELLNKQLIPSRTVLENTYPGMREIGELELSNDSYEYNLVAVLADGDGHLWLATDSGCSCPTPWESHGAGMDELTGPLTKRQAVTEIVSLVNSTGDHSVGVDPQELSQLLVLINGAV